MDDLRTWSHIFLMLTVIIYFAIAHKSGIREKERCQQLSPTQLRIFCTAFVHMEQQCSWLLFCALIITHTQLVMCTGLENIQNHRSSVSHYTMFGFILSAVDLMSPLS